MSSLENLKFLAEICSQEVKVKPVEPEVVPVSEIIIMQKVMVKLFEKYKKQEREIQELEISNKSVNEASISVFKKLFEEIATLKKEIASLKEKELKKSKRKRKCNESDESDERDERDNKGKS